MREIKFRAWTESEKVLVDVLSINFKEKTVRLPIQTPAIAEYWWKETTWNFEDVILMQYTGLKDKEGKEIYEGDILRVWREDEYIPNRDSGEGIVDYDCESGFLQIGNVGFEGCSFDYSTVKTLKGRHEEIHIPIDWLDNYKVIGNIYENSELLGVKNNV